MKIAVTGATDHIGNVLCRMLIENGHQVNALYRKDTEPLKNLDLQLIQGDVRDICQSIITEIHKGRNQEIHLLSGNYYSMKAFAEIVGKAAGKKTPKIVMPFWLMQGLLPFVKIYGKMRGAASIFTIEAVHALKYGHPTMNNAKAKAELNHSCRPLIETISNFYTW